MKTPVIEIVGNHDAVVLTFALDDTDGQGAPIGDRIAEYGDRTVTFSGTFGGGTASVEGSNDGVTYHALNDPQGEPLSFTAPGVGLIVEAPRFIRTVLSGAGAGASVAAAICARRTA